jgi:predicted Zn-ribbon and HTH transcriptional regulator
MSFVQRTALRCDQCGHEWLPRQFRKAVLNLPTHCAKCKSRQWNAGVKK